MKGWQVVFERGVLFAVFVAMLCVSNPVLLYGSEDSLQEVMEGYESPQKLFAPQEDNTQNLNKNGADSITHKHAQQNLQGISPRDMKLPKLPDWIYSTAIIESSFNDGSFKKGLGTLLKNGLYITSSEVIYNGRITPAKIYVKMQDDFNENMMCVAQLSIKAIDLDSGLALLKVAKFVDSYCQMRPAKSYYQDRIYKHFGVDIFASSVWIKPHTEAYYPYLSNDFVFIEQSLKLNKFATYYDFEKRREQVYGFEVERDSYEEFTYGRAFYDKNGVFLGIMSRAGVGYLPVFINRNVIQDFLCDVQEKEIINEDFVRGACKRLGSKRERFFTDMKGRTSFY